MRCLLLVLLLSGCGGTAPEFVPYLQDFQTAAVQNGRPELASFSVRIQFGDAEGNNAECKHDFFAGNFILVDEAKWSLMTPEESRYLIFHELGHCMLGRKHVNDLQGGVPVSIMNGQPMGQTMGFIREDPSSYEHELFNPGDFHYQPNNL